MLLIAHYDEMPPPVLVYEFLHTLKNIVNAERKPFFFTHIEEFTVPTELPNEIYKVAYPSSSPPITKEFDGVRGVAARLVHMMKHSKMLEGAHVAAPLEPWGHICKEEEHPTEVACSLKRPFSSLSMQPQDEAEVQLCHEYQAKLAKLRQERAACAGHMVVKSEGDEAVHDAGVGAHGHSSLGFPLSCMRQEDGSLMLAPQGQAMQGRPVHSSFPLKKKVRIYQRAHKRKPKGHIIPPIG